MKMHPRKTKEVKRRKQTTAARHRGAPNDNLKRTLAECRRELKEALEQQAAAGEVLRVIACSPSDTQPVFDTIATSAARLCNARFCWVFRFDGKLIHFAAGHGLSPEYTEEIRSRYPIPPGRASAVARAVLTGAVAEIPDAQADRGYEHADGAKAKGFRSLLAVPMRNDGHALGAIVIARTQTGRFPGQQIELLRTFAEQAVIAIENVRLFEAEQQRTRELQEALDYQTATSDVLEVISRTPIDLQPVLAAICETVAKLCETKDAEIFIRDGDRLRLGWVQGPIGTEAENWPITRGLVMGRAVLNRELIQVHDLRAAGEEYPEGYQSSLLVGHRTIIAVPLMRKGEAGGVLTLRRSEVKPFTDRQITLLRTFADQAVIAIENTRLLNELRESLQQQTATSDVLKAERSRLRAAMRALRDLCDSI
jgi:two-component system, NtrC family, sensor kinase